MAADVFPAPIATLVTELLHDMGQPLTTLQACGLMPLLSSSDRDALASEMATQVARMTELYRELRFLLAATMPANAEADKLVDLNASLHEAAAEWVRQARRQDVDLDLDLPPQGERVIQVSPRTDRAIRSAATAALANAPTGSQLRVYVVDQPRDGSYRPAVNLEVSWTRSTPEPVGESPAKAEVGLRVAEALLVAEGGRMVYKLQPFRATMELPGTGTLSAR